MVNLLNLRCQLHDLSKWVPCTRLHNRIRIFMYKKIIRYPMNKNVLLRRILIKTNLEKSRSKSKMFSQAYRRPITTLELSQYL